MEYKWPLSVPQFSWKDKFNFIKFLLTNDRWTHGKVVEDFESAMAKYIGSKYALFCSSGSTANTLLAMYLKDHTKGKKYVVVPSTTWITSVAPFIREGFRPYFVDINLEDFSMNLDHLESFLKGNAPNTACVFITSLIGFTPDIDRIKYLSETYQVRIMMDNCENTLGKYLDKNVSSYFTSTTSTYFGHQLQSVEGGFVFTNNDHEYEYFLMARNHGMTRHMDSDRRVKYVNPDVDPRFDFHILGNNFRNTNINAFLGLSDLARANQYFTLRRNLYQQYCKVLGGCLILPRDVYPGQNAPFCLPIILKTFCIKKIDLVKHLCEVNGIETRPIISGNLLRQTCLYGYHEGYPNSEYLHKFGIYIGLHGATTACEVQGFAHQLKELLFK